MKFSNDKTKRKTLAGEVLKGEDREKVKMKAKRIANSWHLYFLLVSLWLVSLFI